MKPTPLNGLYDINRDLIFTYPINTLLDNICDVWPLIMDYYQNFYPFSINNNDKNYRPITRLECLSNTFVRIFSAAYRDDQFKYDIINDHNIGFIKVDGYPLCIDDKPLYPMVRQKKIMICDEKYSLVFDIR